MSSNATLLDLSFEPFLNISKYFLLLWSVINFLKCLYVTLSIVNKRLPPFAVAATFAGVILFYLVQSRDFTWLLVLQLLDFLMIVNTVFTTRDGIFLLALLSITIYFLKPFAFIVDLFVVLFLAIDFSAVFLENTAFWSMLYANCIFLSVAVAKMNSHGPALYKVIPNCLYVCFLASVSCGATNKMRIIPLFVAVVVYVLNQFNREEPISFGSSGFSKLPSNVPQLDLF